MHAGSEWRIPPSPPHDSASQGALVEISVIVRGEVEDDSLFRYRLAAQEGVRIVDIQMLTTEGSIPELNDAIERCESEIVVILSPEICFQGLGVLHRISQRVKSHARIAGAFPRQSLSTAACPLMKRLHYWRSFPAAEARSARLSHNCCAISKSVWKKIPFDARLERCADAVWSARVEDIGMRVEYLPEVRVRCGEGDPEVATYAESYGRGLALASVATVTCPPGIFFGFLLPCLAGMARSSWATIVHLRPWYLPVVLVGEFVSALGRWRGSYHGWYAFSRSQGTYPEPSLPPGSTPEASAHGAEN